MDAVCGPLLHESCLHKRARTPGELLAAALLASSQAALGELMQITSFFFTITNGSDRILKGGSHRNMKSSWSRSTTSECLMEVQEKKGKCYRFPCEWLGTSGGFSERQIRGDTLLALPSASRFERHRAAAGRLTLKGGKHGVNSVSPLTTLLLQVKRLLLEDECLKTIIGQFLKCWCQRFFKYLHF